MTPGIFAVSTGRSERRPCGRCGVVVEQGEFSCRLPDRSCARIWLVPKHLAPCRMPCGADSTHTPQCPVCAALQARSRS
jgi:hypothetical protein